MNGPDRQDNCRLGERARKWQRGKGKEISEEKEKEGVNGSDKYNPWAWPSYAACPEARMKGVSTGSRFSAGRRNFGLLLLSLTGPAPVTGDFAIVGARDVCFFPPSSCPLLSSSLVLVELLRIECCRPAVGLNTFFSRGFACCSF